MIRIRREAGGFSPMVQKAGELPKPATLRRLLCQGWVLPDVQGREIEQWLTAQLRVTQASGKVLAESASKALVKSIAEFLRSRNVRGVRATALESAILGVAAGRFTAEEAVRRIWGVAAREDPGWRDATQALTDAFTETWRQSAQGYVDALAGSHTMRRWLEEVQGGDLGLLSVEFGRPNPRQLPIFRREALALVAEMEESTRRGAVQALERGLTAGRNPLAVARDLPRVGLTEQQAVAVVNYRRELEAGAWDTAQARGLHDQRYAMPQTPEQIDALVERYEERLIDYRTRTIARTEMMRAVNRGAQATWEEWAQQGVVRGQGMMRYWVTAPETASGAGRAWNAPKVVGPCEVCSQIPGMNAEGRGMEESFETPNGQIDSPPVHPNCRCQVFFRPPFLTLEERMALPEEEW